MGLHYCLEGLRSSYLRLATLRKVAATRGDMELESIITELSIRASNVVFPMVCLLDTIYRGRPVGHGFMVHHQSEWWSTTLTYFLPMCVLVFCHITSLQGDPPLPARSMSISACASSRILTAFKIQAWFELCKQHP